MLLERSSIESQPERDSAIDIEEAGLAQAARDLQEDAWAELYVRHREQIYAYIFFRIGDRHIAEDLTADVFLRAIAGIKGYEWRGTPLLAWLYRIAQNVTIDQRKRRARLAGTQRISETFDVEDRADFVSASDERSDMIDAIRLLTDDQQEVLLLRFYGGLSIAQVATVMGKRGTAIKALQARGLRSLRRILSEERRLA